MSENDLELSVLCIGRANNSKVSLVWPQLYMKHIRRTTTFPVKALLREFKLNLTVSHSTTHEIRKSWLTSRGLAISKTFTIFGRLVKFVKFHDLSHSTTREIRKSRFTTCAYIAIIVRPRNSYDSLNLCEISRHYKLWIFISNIFFHSFKFHSGTLGLGFDLKNGLGIEIYRKSGVGNGIYRPSLPSAPSV